MAGRLSNRLFWFASSTLANPGRYWLLSSRLPRPNFVPSPQKFRERVESLGPVLFCRAKGRIRRFLAAKLELLKPSVLSHPLLRVSPLQCAFSRHHAGGAASRRVALSCKSKSMPSNANAPDFRGRKFHEGYSIPFWHAHPLKLVEMYLCHLFGEH